MNEALLKLRKQMIDELGVSVGDVAIPFFTCPQCQIDVENDKLIEMEEYSYSDLFDLEMTTRNHAISLQNIGGPKCPNCGKKTELKHYDYHSYTDLGEKDIIVRRTPKKGLLFKWKLSHYIWTERDGYVKFNSLGDYEEVYFFLSVLFRQLENSLKMDGYDSDRLVKNARRGLRKAPGSKLMLKNAAKLRDLGKTGVAMDIVKQHLELHPLDTKGFELLNRIVEYLAENPDIPKESLKDVIDQLNIALDLQPSLNLATVLLANCYLLKGIDIAAIKIIEQLIRDYPTYEFNSKHKSLKEIQEIFDSMKKR